MKNLARISARLFWLSRGRTACAFPLQLSEALLIFRLLRRRQNPRFHVGEVLSGALALPISIARLVFPLRMLLQL